MPPPTPIYAHGHSTATVASHATRTIEFSAAHLLPHLKPGLAVLDVGCGPGTITAGFARYVAPTGRVVGVDSAAAVIATAQQLQESTHHDHHDDDGGGSRLEFLVGNLLQRLPFADDAFDVVHAHQVVVHLPLAHVAPALREMKRVCKAGGGLVAFRDAHLEKGGLRAWPYDPLLALTMDLFMQRVHLAGGVTPDSVGAWVRIARDEVGFGTVERRFSLDVYDTPALREMWGSQWVSRTEEDGFRSFVKDHGLVSDEVLDELPRAWRKWKDTDDAWCTVSQVEHLLRK